MADHHVDLLVIGAGASGASVAYEAVRRGLSVALLDALRSVDLPTIEIHLTNVYQREEFRHTSFISKAALGVIVGLGSHGYVLGLQALNYHLSRSNQD